MLFLKRKLSFFLLMVANSCCANKIFELFTDVFKLNNRRRGFKPVVYWAVRNKEDYCIIVAVTLKCFCSSSAIQNVIFTSMLIKINFYFIKQQKRR